MPLDQAQWHKPGKINLLINLCGVPAYRTALIEVACVVAALAIIDTLVWVWAISL